MRSGWVILKAAQAMLTGVLVGGLCVNAAHAQDSALVAEPLAGAGFSAQPGATPSVTRAGVTGENDLRCLTLAIAYEAGNQSIAGQEAVAEVVLNRTRHPIFPRSVCGVVFQGWTRHTGCQFTFACDGAIDRRLPERLLAEARGVAERVAGGQTAARVAGALNYHANYVSPAWASRLDRVAKIGAHIFYRPQPGGLPESGRTPALAAAGDVEGQQAIRLYAGYFTGLPAAGPGSSQARADGPSQPDQGAVAERKPFMPWGLSLH